MTRALLERALALLQNCDVSTGVCCCGSPVDKHGMGDGHSPVDEGAYHGGKLLADIRDYLGEVPAPPAKPPYAIQAADVHKLRDMTDAPLMECKKALYICEGNLDAAAAYIADAHNYKHRLYTLTDGPRP